MSSSSALVVVAAVVLTLIDHNGFREHPGRRESIASTADLARYLACVENDMGSGSLTRTRGSEPSAVPRTAPPCCAATPTS